jgi:hypothetical protein
MGFGIIGKGAMLGSVPHLLVLPSKQGGLPPFCADTLMMPETNTVIAATHFFICDFGSLEELLLLLQPPERGLKGGADSLILPARHLPQPACVFWST